MLVLFDHGTPAPIRQLLGGCPVVKSTLTYNEKDGTSGYIRAAGAGWTF
jgi:hypothetical protein